MAKEIKKPKKKAVNSTSVKFAINGSFLDIMKASAKHANNNSAKKPS